MPRHTVDAVGIRPIDLVIIDGIETSSGGEGPWLKELAVQEPGLLLAGRNAVCTDAIATAVMGYDPMAAPGTGPFPGDNHLAMAAALGLGTNDPKQIEVVGLASEGGPAPLPLGAAAGRLTFVGRLRAGRPLAPGVDTGPAGASRTARRPSSRTGRGPRGRSRGRSRDRNETTGTPPP